MKNKQLAKALYLMSKNVLCLLDTSKRSRMILEMYLEGKTTQEIAEHFGLKPARINQLVNKSMVDFNTKLEVISAFIEVFKNTHYINMDPQQVLDILNTQIKDDGEDSETTPDPDKLLILQKSIDELDVSVRVFTCLKNFTIWDGSIAKEKVSLKTLGDVVKYSEKDYLKQRNFGQKHVDELSEALKHFDLKFKEEQK